MDKANYALQLMAEGKLNLGLKNNKNLEIEQMIEASNFLVGTHDFTTFRSSICQSSSPVKTIDQICIKEEIIDDEKIIKFHFQALCFCEIM